MLCCLPTPLDKCYDSFSPGSLLRTASHQLQSSESEPNFAPSWPIPRGRGLNAEETNLRIEKTKNFARVQEVNPWQSCAFSPPRGDKKGE